MLHILREAANLFWVLDINNINQLIYFYVEKRFIVTVNYNGYFLMTQKLKEKIKWNKTERKIRKDKLS